MGKTYRRNPFASSLKEPVYQQQKVPGKPKYEPDLSEWEGWEEDNPPEEDDLKGAANKGFIPSEFDCYQEYLINQRFEHERGISHD